MNTIIMVLGMARLVTSSLPADLEAVRWLSGCWESRQEDRVVVEVWSPPVDGVMVGTGLTSVAGRPPSFEYLRIMAGPSGGIHYIANPSDQSETRFTSTAVTAGGFLVENQAHDFPTQIEYLVQGADRFAARVQGPDGSGGLEGFELEFVRTRCEGDVNEVEAATREVGTSAGGSEILRDVYFSGLPVGMAERAWAPASDFDASSVLTTSRSLASGAQSFESASDLETIRVPTLFVPGDDDVHPYSVFELSSKWIPDARAALTEEGITGSNISLLEEAIRRPDLRDLDWMTGHWNADALGGTAEEAWLPSAGNSMHGVFRHTVDGELRFSEFMQVTVEDHDVILRFRHFNPDYSTWEDDGQVMEFRLHEASAGVAVFVAANEISPDRLVYARQGETLAVEISGVPPFRFELAR